MDTRDSKVFSAQECQEKFPNLEDQKRTVEFLSGDMTGKQRERRQVSLHDHRSKLGKILTDKRRQMGIYTAKNRRS